MISFPQPALLILLYLATLAPVPEHLLTLATLELLILSQSVLLVMASQGVLQLGKMDRRMSGFLDIDGMAGELSTALLSAWGADPDVLAAAATLTATIR